MAARANRMPKELKELELHAPEGVSTWPIGDSLYDLGAKIQGPPGSVYADGWFELSIEIPAHYPFDPPKVRFKTSVYHPNIDDSGRICLDMLNLKPKGCWSPAMSLRTVLAGVRQLLAEPNPQDGLMPEVTQEYQHNRELFNMKARSMVRRYASITSVPNSMAEASSVAAAQYTGTLQAMGAAGGAAQGASSAADDPSAAHRSSSCSIAAAAPSTSSAPAPSTVTQAAQLPARAAVMASAALSARQDAAGSAGPSASCAPGRPAGRSRLCLRRPAPEATAVAAAAAAAAAKENERPVEKKQRFDY